MATTKTIQFNAPCAVGDFVYTIGFDGDNDPCIIKECVVDVSMRRLWTDRTNSDGYNHNALGITFFLSKEDAETAIKAKGAHYGSPYFKYKVGT